jgi:hypothetical protein
LDGVCVGSSRSGWRYDNHYVSNGTTYVYIAWNVSPARPSDISGYHVEMKMVSGDP